MGTAHVFGLAERWDPHTEETANAHRSRNGRDVSVTESQTSTSRPPERSHAHKRTMLGADRRARAEWVDAPLVGGEHVLGVLLGRLFIHITPSHQNASSVS